MVERPEPAPHGESFAAWLSGFRARAAAQGAPEEALKAALDGIAPLPEVLARFRAQPEAQLSLADYMRRAAPPERLAGAALAARRHARLLNEVEERHGVDPAVVVAIWALESDLGRRMGETPVPSALATLAWEGRRRKFFEQELLGAVRMVAAGVPSERLVGSWAGAMGHGQFMPSSWLAHAVDHDGDGGADIWSADPADGLASIANYLSAHGWQAGEPIWVPAQLPQDPEPALAVADAMLSAEAWRALGVAAPEPPARLSRLVLPAGTRGPAFLAGPNFNAVLRYNAAMPYALAVGWLARHVGGARWAVAWPAEPPLARAEIEALQKALARRGHLVGPVDGLLGPATRRAVASWQREQGELPDGWPDRSVFHRIVE